MYEAEVLGTRVVVQHLPLGGLLEWNIVGAPPPETGIPRTHICTPTPVRWVSGAAVHAAGSETVVTAVPWGSSGASISEGRSAEPSFPRPNSHPKGS